MKLSIHTTTTQAEERNYPYLEALKSFCAVADEVIVVDGGSTDGSVEKMLALDPKIKVITLPWPEEYDQAEFPKHLNAGLEACTGDWAIKCDIDYIFHEKDIIDLQVRLRGHSDKAAAMTLEKFNVINRFRGFRKARIPFCINLGYSGNAIRYGRMIGEGLSDDWSYPVLAKHTDEFGVVHGEPLKDFMVYATGVDVWNYDYFFRTKEETKKLFARNARAWRRSVDSSWGKDDEDAFTVFLAQARGRLQKVFVPLEVISHPVFIRERIAAMTPDMFGFDNWGMSK